MDQLVNKGLFIRRINSSSSQILNIFLATQFICLFPFFITDLVLTNYRFTPCLLANFICSDFQVEPNCAAFIQQGPYLTLGKWLQYDGYIKLAVFACVLFFKVLDTQTANKQMLVTVCGNIIRFFYLFYFGWAVAGSCLFFGSYYGFPGQTYKFCQAPYTGYFFFLFIFSYIIIPINLGIGSARSNENLSQQISVTAGTTRRDTQMMNKQKLIVQ